MGTSSNGQVLLRGVPSALGLAGVVWSLVSVPLLQPALLAKETASQILSNDHFKPGVLKDILAVVEATKNPIVSRSDTMRAVALIRVRIAEGAMGRNDPAEADRQASVADEQIRASLEFSPADSLFWLLLYSVDIQGRGFDQQSLKYMEQSYISGPREGWIALRRNRSALAVFEMLNAATQEAVILEFTAEVRDGYPQEAADALTSVGWASRERLVGALANTDIASRETFAKAIARTGAVVSVPGIILDKDRLWH